MIVFMTTGAAVMVLFNTIAAILSAAKTQKKTQLEESKQLTSPEYQEMQG
jgi:hypothetical protein